MQGSASASQFRVATVGKNFSASPSCSPALPVAIRPRARNPLSHRRFPSRSPIGALSPSERTLYRGMKLDDSADSTYSPPAARPVRVIRRMFDKETTVDPIECTPKDASMMMGDGKTTESDGLGDSKHAGPSCVAGVVGSSSTDYGSMPPLPSTLADTVSMDVAEDGARDVPVFDDLSDVATSDIPMAVGGGKDSNGTGLGDSQHASPEDSPDPMGGRLLIDLSGEYSQFSDVGHDVRQLSSVIVTMGNVIRRLERKIHDLEDGVDNRERAAVPAVSVPTVSMPAVFVPAVPASRKTPHVEGKGKKVNHVLPVRPLTTPTVWVVRPTDIPAPACGVPVAPPVKPTWSAVAKATGGESGFTLVKRSGRKSSPPPAPKVSERDRHVIVRFEKRGHKVRLPAGVNTETIKNGLNRVLSTGGDARFGSCVQHRTSGDLLLSLVQHSAASVWGFVSRMERALMELGINRFSISQDRKRVKILVSGLSLSPLGVGSLWKPEDWQGDGAFDDMIRDLEVTNPGINVVGRPHWIGSLVGHKSHKHTTGSVVFVVELTDIVKGCLDRRSVMVFSRRRPVRIWAELKATSVCTRCLRHGHVAVMCRSPIACKFCDGGHLSTAHKCPVRDCSAAVGMLCSHVSLSCRLCSRVGHLTGDLSCPNLRAPTATASGSDSSPSSGKMVSEETTKLGITDRSVQKLVKSSKTMAVDRLLADPPAPLKANQPRRDSF